MTSMPVLKRGDDGNAVMLLQCLLCDIYKYKITITLDGNFGEETEDLVRAFQAGQGITQDGVVGNDETWPALISDWWRLD